jgi:hypothetical protein
MIAHSPNSLCKEAELYYYDFLFNESRGLIPKPTIDHIEKCQHCKEQISKLKTVLSQAESIEAQQKQVSSAVATMLKLHFAYISKPVTCNIVKPFLPTLLDQALEIHIPTPIITHICNCQQCSEDLDIIKCLNLNRKQLCRLSQLFADEPLRTNISCSKAQKAIPAVVSMVFSETDSEVLKHLCNCSVCRDLLYKERQKICESIPEHVQPSGFPCESVSASDIFDYVVPYGLDPGKDQYAKFRPSFISHVRSCSTCLMRMQELHSTVFYIAERPESEVVTIYNVDESAKTQAAEYDELYSGFPVKVGVTNSKDEVETEPSASTIDFVAGLRRKISAMNLKPLVKTTIAAAAVILIAVALFFNIPTAKAVTIEQIYKAIEKVRNVHISRFVPDKAEPTQEKWVSRTLNIYMTKTGKQLVLWDIPNRVRRIKYLDTTLFETAQLSDDIIAKIGKRITGSLGLLPFPDISKVPKDAGWKRVTDESLKLTDKDTELYDLAWTSRKDANVALLMKCRVFVDAETNLPLRTEFYRKSATDSEYNLETLMVVRYLSDSEIQAIVKESFF